MQLIWLSGLSIGTNVLALALPLALLQVYDRIIPNQSEGSAIVIFGGVSVALILAGVFRYVRSVIFARKSAEQDFYTSMKLARTLLRSNASEQEGRAAIASSSRARDLHVGQTLIALYDAPFAIIFLSLVWFLGGPVVLAPLVIVCVVSVGLLFGIGTFREVLSKSVDAETELAAKASELLASPEDAAPLERTAHGLSVFTVLRRAQASISQKLDRFSVLQTDVMQTAGLASTVGIVGWGAASVLAGDMTTGGLAACTLLGSRGSSQMIGVVASLVRYQSTVVAAKRLAEVPELHDGALSGLGSTDSATVLVCDHEVEISKTGLTALKVLDADTRNRAIRDLTEFFWSSQDLDVVALVPRNPTLLFGTLLENISRFSNKREDQALVLSKDLGLDAMVGRLAKGYYTQVSSNVDGPLSNGALKRAAVVQALAGDPQVLILDGPEAGLDANGLEKLLARLKTVSESTAVVLLTGAPALLEAADPVIELTASVQKTAEVTQ